MFPDLESLSWSENIFIVFERKLVKGNREEICMVEAGKGSCRVIISGEDLGISA